MLEVYGHYYFLKFFQCWDRLYTTEADVYRQILTYKDGPCSERVKRQNLTSGGYVLRGNGPRDERVTFCLSLLTISIRTSNI